MSEFGWAFVSGSNAGGINDSVQIKLGTDFTGSKDFTYDIASSTVALTGTLNVSGTVNANAFNLDVTNKNVTNLSITGSSKFGDTSDDLHQFTGSIGILGSMSSSLNMSASSYFGDGSNLSNVNAVSVSSPLNVPIISGSTAISGAAGFFGSVTAVTFTGTATKATVTDSTANTSFPVVFNDEANGLLDDTGTFTYNPNSATLSATNVAGTLSTAAQTNITSVGTLSALGVTGDLTVDTSTLKVDSSNNRVGMGRVDPQKTLEVLKADQAQMRLSYSKYSFGVSENVFSDFETVSTGILVVSASGGGAFVSGTVQATSFHGDGSNLTGIASTLNDITTNGNTTANAITASAIRLTTVPAGTATTSSYLALDSSNNVILTSSSGAGAIGEIGNAEDGDYTDGLYTDFTTTTQVGVAIDRFNEVLKILAPSPAPSVQSINEDVTDGVTAKLSFGSDFPLASYISSANTAGFTAVDRSGSYSAATAGSNIRLGVYDGTQNITGFINHDVVESVANTYIAYSNDAFGSANEGTLKLELNGAVVHSVSLSGLAGAGNPNSGSASSLTGQSGFTNVSVTASSFDGNNAEWYIFKHRTAKYKIAAADQKVGWNYLRVVHSITSDNATNYIEWINDPSGAVDIAEMSASLPRIENVSLVGSKYLSGVEYNTDATANYKTDLINLYNNVYAASGTPISFATSNSSVPSAQSVPDISVSENPTKVLGITGSLNFNQTTLFNATMSCNISVTHPIKETISNTGSAEANGFLIDTRTLASNNLEEKFHDETLRKTSGSYDTQGSVTAASSIWSSQNHMTGGGATGHTDGLLFHNQRLYSPVDGDVPNGGNFNSILNVESNQPNYSGVTGTRTFYRVLTNSSGVTKRDIKLVSTKNSTTYNNSTLGAGNVHLFAKIPGTTGWMDVSQNFVYGSVSDGAGALLNESPNDVDSGNNIHHISFGTASVSNNEYVMLKILADESWSGYISELSFSLGAGTGSVSDAPALDDIDANNTGVNAKLSFGSSNVVANYSNATGSSISLSDTNSNGSYIVSGDKRGVFAFKQNLDGTLNEDVTSNGNNYSIDSFKNAYTGSLTLEVNGLNLHTIELNSSLQQISSSNSNASGIVVSPLEFGKTTSPENVTDYTKTFRTGSYHVGPNDQNLGWNYARVKHTIGASTTNTNYVEWVIDTNANALAATTVAISNFNHLDLYYQSGIAYFASRPSGSYTYEASSVYRNIYSNETLALQFPTTTNCSISNIRIVGDGVTTFDSAVSSTGLPNLNNSSDCEQQDIQVTGTVLFDSLTSISGGLSLFTDRDVTVNSAIHHPLKTDLTSSSQSKTSFMVYSGSIGSTSLSTNEYFGTETYRIVSGNYVNQTDATNSGNAWNPQTHMNAANTHGDGMVTANGYAISPLQIGNDGDTRNTTDGGSLQSPPSNPDYSSLSDNIRTYYRYFRNTTGQAKPTFTVTLYGKGNLVAKSGAFYTGALDANDNINVELKVPFDSNFAGDDDTSTAWGDAVKPYSAGVQPTTDGVGIYSGGGSGLDQNLDGGAAIGIQLQEKQVRDDQYFVIKISAHKEWTGYISRILITY